MPIRFKRAGLSTALSTAIALAFNPVLANAPDEAAIVVTATRLPTPDVLAPYASEVHTRRMIEQSGAATLLDYLGQNTSVQVLPSYGNKATPKIDMRGYGIGDGYQNIVVSIDGQRLNSIDMSPQLMGAIPLAGIDRIEITKGSGSVMFGDGATAGTIQIYTRPVRGISLKGYTGSHNSLGTTLGVGAGNDSLQFTASYDKSSSDGASNPDISGHKATADSDVARLGVTGRPSQDIALKLDASSTRMETRYPGSLTQAQFDADPSQNGGGTYTYQEFKSDYLRGGIEYRITDQLKIMASRGVEDKRSRYVISGWTSDYDYISDEVSGSYKDGRIALTGGYQGFDGTRIGSFDRTTKKNSAWFGQGQVYLDQLTLSLGIRSDEVSYAYRPTAGASLRQSHGLYGWDIGGNYRINATLTLFANLNSAFQAPDIDRFFSNGAFNQFIQPAKVHTLNLGINHVTATNRLKATLFRANLKNEIYYYSTGIYATSYNTNIDASHKYGLELQDTWQATDRLSLSANYAYTRAIIDHENDGGSAYDGKDLPGVPRNAINLGMGYRIDDRSSIRVSHVWRQATWAANDFDNNNVQKQRAYASTDMAYRFRYKDLTLFAAVENLFSQHNGIWVRDNAIYPVNFSRNWRLGLEATF
ncbi:MAG: TonB-dependent receptor [Rhodocyclaceae bacterium]|nr:TonB-dependent receptor [Rhodocyclaceae bacterium]